MGLFSRKESTSHRRPVGRSRPSVSSEAQAAELRVKARRRLAGAVAIVLCAIIVLPMLLDGEPIKVPANIEVTIPNRNAPFNPDLPTPASQAKGVTATDPTAELATQPSTGSTVQKVDLSNVDVNKGTLTPTTPQKAPAQSEVSQPVVTDTKPLPPVTPTPPARSDEGARARAILEGRTVPSAESRSAQTTPSIKESLVVQIASYSAQADAQARSETLKGQGITNAYVEPVMVNGKQVFRLRVGPFSSREAAQAGQARLRTLGYANGFITTQ
jgi:DedD protein